MSNGNNPFLKPNGKKDNRAPVWRTNKVSDNVCHWGDIDPTTLRLAIDAVTRAGGAIMLGLTSDGGAYSICVLQGNEKAKEYPHGKLEAEETLKALADWYVEFNI